MFARKPLIVLLSVTICAFFASSVKAKKHTIYIDSSALKTYQHADEERGDYYTLQFQVPAEVAGKELYGVILELYLDVTGVARDDTSVKIPVIEVYALKSVFSGSLTSAEVEVNTGTIRNVPPGQSRRLRVDITDIVRGYVKEPATNHGLIIGGLATYREGSIEVQSNAVEGSYTAKIDFHYNARAGD